MHSAHTPLRHLAMDVFSFLLQTLSKQTNILEFYFQLSVFNYLLLEKHSMFNIKDVRGFIISLNY